MSILNNGKVLSRGVDLCDDSVISQAFRSALAEKEQKKEYKHRRIAVR
jgi:hypothetical protein